MKKLLLAVGLVCAAGFAQAQYYAISYVNAGENPGNVNQEETEFPVGGGLSAGWTPILQGPAASPTWSSYQSIPFTFNWNGGPVTDYRISSSGILSFSLDTNAAAPSYTNGSLPSAQIPDSSVAIWGLSVPNSGDNVVTKTFGTAPNRQHWVFYTSCNFNNSTNNGQWTYWSIVLEESTDKIYIVDQRTANGTPALTLGIQLDGSTAVEIPGSPNIGSYSINAPDASDNSYYEFNFGTQPALDLDNVSIDNSPFQLVNSGGDITGTVRNLGASTVTEFEVAYSVDGGTPVTGSITGVSIASGATYSYTHPTQWTPTTEGTVEVETEVTSVNTGTDANASNNTAMTDILVHPTPVPRLPLIESFTSSTCPPCAPGNQNVASVLGPFTGQYSMVKYQMSWPGTGDPYFTDEGGQRRFYYGINSVPAILTDAVFGSGGGNSNSYVPTDFTAAADEFSFVEIETEASIVADMEFKVVGGQLELDNVEYGEITINSDITPVLDLPSGQTIQVAILEHLTFDNVKSNGETEFEYVLKKFVPNATGTALPAIAKNSTHDHDVTYEFKGDYRLPNNALDPINHASEHSVEEFDDLVAVVWIQDDNDGYVWQSQNMMIELDSVLNYTVTQDGDKTIYTVDGVEYEMFGNELAPLGTKDVFAATVDVFPNPANTILNIKGVSNNATVQVYDAMGRMVANDALSFNTLDVSSLPAGVYNLVIEDGDERTTKRVSIAH